MLGGFLNRDAQQCCAGHLKANRIATQLFKVNPYRPDTCQCASARQQIKAADSVKRSNLSHQEGVGAAACHINRLSTCHTSHLLHIADCPILVPLEYAQPFLLVLWHWRIGFFLRLYALCNATWLRVATGVVLWCINYKSSIRGRPAEQLPRFQPLTTQGRHHICIVGPAPMQPLNSNCNLLERWMLINGDFGLDACCSLSIRVEALG